MPPYTDCVTALTNDSSRSQNFPPLLLHWYADKKRDLPWRRTRDPYAVWVSEMMCQQTQVATAIPFWNRWMARFPTVRDLAEAPLDDVLKQWQGLGYYARARSLHRAAQKIVAEHDGVFPTCFDDVLALPGIGRYTAGAVCSIAFGHEVPIVDANVIRVLCRVYGLRGDPKSTKVQEQLWTLAAHLIPPGRANDFNQGMMELGALVCGAKPRCGLCPVSAICAAFASGTPDAFPEFAPKKAFTSQTDVSAIIMHPSGDGRILLIQRPPDALWGGLWEMPRVTQSEGETVTEAAGRAAREIAALVVQAQETVSARLKHGVTTRKITLLAVPCTLPPAEVPNTQTVGGTAWAWVSLAETDRYALSSPQARLIEQLRAHTVQPSLFV